MFQCACVKSVFVYTDIKLSVCTFQYVCVMLSISLYKICLCVFYLTTLCVQTINSGLEFHWWYVM